MISRHPKLTSGGIEEMDATPQSDEAFTREVQRRFRGQDGVVMRLWECSGTLAGLRTTELVERCARHEMSISGGREALAASLLRWDVPTALYAGGRMMMSSASELSAMPWRSGELCGCDGLRVASTMLGWVFYDIPLKRRGLATAHDSWQVSNKPCSPFPRPAASSSAYALARLQMGPTNPSDDSNRLLRCPHEDWNAMLHDQHAYAMALHARWYEPGRLRKRPTCGYGADQLYNQVNLCHGLCGSAVSACCFFTSAHPTFADLTLGEPALAA